MRHDLVSNLIFKRWLEFKGRVSASQNETVVKMKAGKAASECGPLLFSSVTRKCDDLVEVKWKKDTRKIYNYIWKSSTPVGQGQGYIDQTINIIKLIFVMVKTCV